MKKYFGTDGVRGPVGEYPMSADWILKLGWAVGQVLSNNHNRNPLDQKHQVLIGKDTRISGDLVESALQAGLTAAGIDVIPVDGVMPTPGVAYLTRTLGADLGIVISASHNPYYDNGIKFFSSAGEKLPDDQEFAIEAALEAPLTTADSNALGKRLYIPDLANRYAAFCKTTFPEPLRPLAVGSVKLVMDCANGATYKIAPSVFRELGIEVIEMGNDPNGFNINRDCGSTHPLPLAAQVVLEKADLGIAFDGDGDRLIMVDHSGAIVDGDELLFIIAKWYAATNRLAGGVVGTVMSNYGLEKAFASLAIPFLRTAVGDRYVMESLKKNAWNLGGESSGHILCLDANSTGDGIISALRVLAAMAFFQQSLQELKAGMIKYPQTLINVRVSSQVRINRISDPKIQSAIRIAENHLNGQGRVLLRPSGTEPLVRVMVEGQDLSSVEAIASELAEVVKCVMV